MATRSELVDKAKEAYNNHGVYIGTGNGVPVMDLTIRDIYEMEKAYGRPAWRNDIKRDLAFIGKQIADGVSLDKALAGDCSGIIVKFLRDLGLIKPTADYAARQMQSTLTVPVDLQMLQPGDLVYDKTSQATHVGIYLGNNQTFESKGRDHGMIIRSVKEGPWVIGGCFKWWVDEKTEFTFTRNLKYTAGKSTMKGEDVRILQTKLAELGYYTDSIDGSYGKNTAAAVVRYQRDHGLTPDGIAGSHTITDMGYLYS